MHVLVVEDDPLIADHIVSGLKLGGHTARLAVTGADAARAIADGVYDAVVLDRMLPDINGLSVIDQVRAKGGAMPILMLSALGSVKNRIEGLQAGADDYLAKPFSMDELDARLQAIVRRGTPQAGKAILQIGALKLDVASHSVSYGASSMILNRKQYSLLAHLMHNADRIVTRTMLLEAVWSYSFSTTTNIVESNMSRLRTALQEIGCDPIDTQRGAGYVLRTERCT
ncbi:two component transcriptional regulator [Sphingomonas sp. LH128]|uniref:DNA-binding response regulator n=1 Tax=Novosphingobium resinovorum TaxID=158500 RepID=A0A031K112_9SPHN|nr:MULTISPECIES: response regulator transcription factor [Sphingomonadaceae]AOR78951.1 DNA-binding response regulator [Novosphingobium resinovorum]EJU14197.1 two component transcriptional regulator [Sphingomonas sp. LH128]EZP82864.1 Two component transcriptional regulator [Novosphingobium resinovorum]